MIPPVTVIIPAYKAAATIVRAVNSALAQPEAEVEVVVVVDGPDAETERLLHGIDPRVRVLVNAANRGVQVTRNRGLSAARHQWSLFLDADDLLEGDLMGAGARQMEIEAADIGLAAMTVREEPSGRSRTVRLAGDRAAVFAGWLGHNRFVAPCSVLWRTEYLRAIGGWDEALYRQEDGELVMRALLRGARMAHLRSGTGVYVQHPAPQRLTARSDNLLSLLDVPAKLLSLAPGEVAATTVRRAAARSYANAARTCLLRGRVDVADEAVRRMRTLGGAKPHAAAPFSALYSVLPLRAAARAETIVRRLLNKPY